MTNIMQTVVEKLKAKYGDFEEVYQDHKKIYGEIPLSLQSEAYRYGNKSFDALKSIEEKHFWKGYSTHYLNCKKVEPTSEMLLHPSNPHSFVPGYHHDVWIERDKEGFEKYKKYLELRIKLDIRHSRYENLMSFSDEGFRTIENASRLNGTRQGLDYTANYPYDVSRAIQRRKFSDQYGLESSEKFSRRLEMGRQKFPEGFWDSYGDAM